MRPLMLALALAFCLSAHLGPAGGAPASTGADVAEHQQQETLETLHLGEPGSDDTTVRDKRTIGPLRQLFPGLSQAEAENQLAGSESQISEVRVQLNDKQDVPAQEEEEDLKPAASGDNLAEADDGAAELENETDGANDDENRNKRFLPFNLNGASAGSGSGGGSGNFLFDIIRWLQRMADTAARVTGKVYRVVAGTDNAGLGFKIPTSYNQQPDDSDNKDSDNNSNDDNKSSASNINTSFSFDSSFVPRLLIAGSGTTQAQDEAENAPLDGSTSSAGASAGASASAGAEASGRDDGYQEGVPGPITRLFVIANRGIANLVQDLILRLAQTSERLVNFKARLITSII